jgi:hypothetical protein
MHAVWKSRGKVHEFFAKFWEGGYLGVVKIFWGEGTAFGVYCSFINKFCKNVGGRIHFYPPLTHSPPSPPVCLRYRKMMEHMLMVIKFVESTMKLQ